MTRTVIAVVTVALSAMQNARPAPPAPPGRLVDIGCTAAGSPTVLLENGTGDFSVIWALVQPGVAKFTRVCSYDRGGYAWSDPGTRPRTFAQLALELRSALRALDVPPPHALVGQFPKEAFNRPFRERRSRTSRRRAGSTTYPASPSVRPVRWSSSPGTWHKPT
jgi:hypothetical protein